MAIYGGIDLGGTKIQAAVVDEDKDHEVLGAKRDQTPLKGGPKAIAARMAAVLEESLDEAGLPPQARAFYAENRRVANGKAKRVLGWKPAFPTYREGLRALSASTMPATDASCGEPLRKNTALS